MRGSIVKRQGKGRKRGKPEDLYYVVYQVGKRQKWEAVEEPRTRKHAEKLLAQRLQELHTGTYVELKSIIFSEFKERWVSQYAENQVVPNTMERYRSQFKLHLIPAFGDRELIHISTEDIQRYRAEKERTLAPGTVKQHLSLLRQMFDHAIDWDYLKKNPAKKVANPKIPKTEKDFLSPTEVRELLLHTQEKWYAFILVAVVSGLRIGELLAMKWSNLEWDKGRYLVRENLQRKTSTHPKGFSEPKTDESAAPVDISPKALEALRAHKKRQAAEKLRAGEKYSNRDLVFATFRGEPLDHWNVKRRVLEPALDSAGLRTIRFHDLRHTCAALLINQGESPKYIQKQLRHASIEMTFDTYGHLFPEAAQEAVQRLDGVLFAEN
jgi:integrase